MMLFVKTNDGDFKKDEVCLMVDIVLCVNITFLFVYRYAKHFIFKLRGQTFVLFLNSEYGGL